MSTEITASGVESTSHRNERLGQLYQQYRPRLHHFIRSRIHDKDEADDLAQQAFAEAVRVYASFRGESEIHTWLYAIATNLMRNYMSRSPRRRYEWMEDELIDEQPHSDRDPCAFLSDQQVVSRLFRYINALPTELKKTLLLVAMEDLSYPEAAQILNVPVGTVRSRLSRSRAILRGKLAAVGIYLEL